MVPVRPDSKPPPGRLLGALEPTAQLQVPATTLQVCPVVHSAVPHVHWSTPTPASVQTHAPLGHPKPVSPQAEVAVAVHSTHMSVVGAHTGVGALHSALSTGSHAPQAPVFAPAVAHTVPLVFALHWASIVHAPQVRAVPSQMGVIPVHSALSAGSHAPQAPVLAPAVAHTVPLVMALHSVSLAQARHILPAPHTGVDPLQSAEETHWMQVLVAVLQIHPRPAQADVSPASHSTQAPDLDPASAHTSVPVLPVQSPSAVQAAQA